MNQEALNTIIVLVITPILAAVVPLVIKAINLYATKIGNQIADAELRKYVSVAEDAIVDAVNSTYQTYVKVLKERGEWTEEAEREAFEKSKTEALLIMGTSAKEALKLFYDDFDKWIDAKIEKTVKTAK